MTLTKEQLDELQRLEAEATEGPWRPTRGTTVSYVCGAKGSGTGQLAKLYLGGCGKEDAAFIAAARNALPALLDELRSARKARTVALARLCNIRDEERLNEDRTAADRIQWVIDALTGGDHE